MVFLTAPVGAHAVTDGKDDEVVVSGPTKGRSTDRSPARIRSSDAEEVDWAGVMRQSARFLAVEHGVRLATEAGTRNGFRGSYFRGYLSSVSNLHGWSDGDGFLVNYVGHPMQGAVAGYIWLQNDPRYREAEIGRNRDYWRGLARAAAFSAVYSTQFEVGPLSEASIGQIQRRYPQQGLVDHVVTPSLGVGWMLAEDWVDKYLIKRLEATTDQRWVRLLVRGGLNPSRSFANLMAGRVPWHRQTRPGVLAYDAVRFEQQRRERSLRATEHRAGPLKGVAPFELSLIAQGRSVSAAGNGCAGGGAEVAFRLAPEWQLVGEISGCTRLDLPQNTSGDSLSFLLGPRWTPTIGRWRPYLQVLVGGTKLTTETVDPAVRAALLQQTGGKLPSETYELYARRDDAAGLALKAGGGVNWKINEAFALKLAGIDYAHTWLEDPRQAQAGTGLQVAAGVVLRFGTW